MYEPVEGLDETGNRIGTQGRSKRNYFFLRTFQGVLLVQIDTLEQDITNPRFGLPLMYITFNDGKNSFS